MSEKLVSIVDLPTVGKMYVANSETASLETLQDIQEPLEKLYNYEQKEEKMLLLELPCRIGTFLYDISPGCVVEFEVVGYKLDNNKWYVECLGTDELHPTLNVPFNEVGKTIYLTRDEAEKELGDILQDSYSYTVCFLFNQDGSKVLLQKKNKTDYKGCYNGVGGEFEDGETAYQCAVREIAEETGVDVETHVGKFTNLCDLKLPYDCKLSMDVECNLSFWAGILSNISAVSQQPNEPEKLEWVSTQEILRSCTDDIRFAGEGNLQYVINIAYKKLFGGK